jgi:hypothetical protein
MPNALMSVLPAPGQDRRRGGVEEAGPGVVDAERGGGLGARLGRRGRAVGTEQGVADAGVEGAGARAVALRVGLGGAADPDVGVEDLDAEARQTRRHLDVVAIDGIERGHGAAAAGAGDARADEIAELGLGAGGLRHQQRGAAGGGGARRAAVQGGSGNQEQAGQQAHAGAAKGPLRRPRAMVQTHEDPPGFRREPYRSISSDRIADAAGTRGTPDLTPPWGSSVIAVEFSTRRGAGATER